MNKYESVIIIKPSENKEEINQTIDNENIPITLKKILRYFVILYGDEKNER